MTNLGSAASLGAGQFSWSQLQQITINSIGFTIPSATFTFIKDNTNAELLAKPQLRISEGQKAQLLIGSKVPVPVTSFQSVGAGVGGAVTSPVTSFQYQDIGIKIEVEPRVHHNKEVTLKLMVEVSNQEGNAPGTTQPQFGTRTISSNIRLKDGETNFLAGLYRLDKSDIKNTIPFIGDIPIIGLLFTHNTNDHQTTDLVLTLTPHIIRIPDVTEEDVTPYFVGTDSNISYQGGPRVENPTRDNGPFEQPPAGAKVPAPNQGRTPPQPAPPGAGDSPAGRSGLGADRHLQAASGAAAARLAAGAGPAAVVVPVLLFGMRRPSPTKSEAADAGSDQALFDFDPPAATLAVGAQQSILVRATSAAALTGSTVAIRFDPAVVTPVVVRPILGNGSGTADAVVQKDHIVIQFPERRGARRHARPGGDHAARGRAGPFDPRLRADGHLGRGRPVDADGDRRPMTLASSAAAPADDAGFTMVEIAIVAAMIAILAAMAVPVARYSLRRQKELELRYQLRMMRDTIDKYKQMSDAGLIPLEVGGEGFPPDLETLVKGVNLVGQVSKKHRFMRKIPIDPMTSKAEWGLRSYQDESDSFSWGGQNVYDVYSLSEARALDGTYYKDW